MRRADRDSWEPPGVSRRVTLSRQEERLRPLYSRMLGLRHINPNGLLCFVFFEGTLMLAVLLALAELVSWWAIITLPLSVALIVKVNDEVAAAVTRSAAQVPQRERERFRRELSPAVGRAAVPVVSRAPLPVRSRHVLGAGGATTVTGTAVVPYRWESGSAAESPTAGFSRALPLGRAAPAVLRAPSGAQRALPAGPTGSSRPTPGTSATFSPPGPANTAGNAYPVGSSEHRPTIGWHAGLDPVDSPEQRARQTGRGRYGGRRSND